jgi:hypothetical protein
MFTDDSLATAEIAKIFGSELLHVQNQARTDAGAQPEILKMHPTQFLGSAHQQNRPTKHQEAELLRRLQREAEAACPLPPSEMPQSPIQTNVPASPPILQTAPPVAIAPLSNVEPFDSTELKKLNHNLNRIATILEKSIELFAKTSVTE